MIRIILTLAASALAVDYTMPIGNRRVIWDKDLCNYTIISGDDPGASYRTVGRVCKLPTKAEWSKGTGLDTTVTDTTKAR